MQQFINTFRVGWFLAVAQTKRAGTLTTTLTIAVMVFSFLAQVFISGIMIGLIEGSSVEFREKYIGDMTISPLEKKSVVERSYEITQNLANNPLVSSYSARYITGGKFEANYGTRSSNDAPNTQSGQVYGIDISKEEATTKFSENIIEGDYLTDADSPQYILVGSGLLDRYSDLSDVIKLLSGVYPGSKIRITINGNTEEFIVKGIFKTKVDFIGNSIFMREEALKRLTGNNTSNVNEIAVRAVTIGDEFQIKQDLILSDFDSYAKIQTYDEGEPAFVKNLKKLFGLLGTMFGSITLIVAVITVYIVISINTLTRRKFIGILKGIGIRGSAIELAYVIQSLLYALIGVAIGSLIIFGMIKPYFDANPINFPFSDGILVATIPSTALKAIVLVIFAVVAAYLAARGTIRQNTLDAILGRNPAKKQRTGKRNIIIRIIIYPYTILRTFIEKVSNKNIQNSVGQNNDPQ